MPGQQEGGFDALDDNDARYVSVSRCCLFRMLRRHPPHIPMPWLTRPLQTRPRSRPLSTARPPQSVEASPRSAAASPSSASGRCPTRRPISRRHPCPRSLGARPLCRRMTLRAHGPPTRASRRECQHAAPVPGPRVASHLAFISRPHLWSWLICVIIIGIIHPPIASFSFPHTNQTLIWIAIYSFAANDRAATLYPHPISPTSPTTTC